MTSAALRSKTAVLRLHGPGPILGDMQGWIGVIAGGLGFAGGALSVRWRALAHGRLAAGQVLWLLMLGSGAATIVRSSAELGGWRGGGLATSEIFRAVFASAFLALFAVFAARRAMAKRPSRKSRETPVMESLAQLESLFRAKESELQTVYRSLEEFEALQNELETLTAELQTVFDSDSAAVAGSSAEWRDVFAALYASAANMTTVARELRSALEALQPAADRLRAAIAAGEVIGPLTEVEEAFSTLSDRLPQLGEARVLSEEARQNLDRAFEWIVETKARLAEDAPRPGAS